MDNKKKILEKKEQYKLYPAPNENHTRSLVIEKKHTYYIPENKANNDSNNTHISLKTEERKYWTF